MVERERRNLARAVKRECAHIGAPVLDCEPPALRGYVSRRERKRNAPKGHWRIKGALVLKGLSVHYTHEGGAVLCKPPRAEHLVKGYY